jgi:hypothetical protein
MIRPCQINERQEVSMLTEIFDRSCGCGFIGPTNLMEIRLRVAESMRTTLSYGPCWKTVHIETLANK